MDRLENLMSKYPNISFEFESMPHEFGGFNVGDQITINSNLSKEQQLQWLSEEIGHYKTSVGDISNYDRNESAQQEQRARHWGYQHLLSENDVKSLTRKHPENDYELADDLGMQVNFLHEIGITYGLHYKHALD